MNRPTPKEIKATREAAGLTQFPTEAGRTTSADGGHSYSAPSGSGVGS